MKNKHSKADICLRVGLDHWYDEKYFEKFLNCIKTYSDCFDQIMFFTSPTHSPLKFEIVSGYFEILKDRVRRTKAAGFSTGINVLTTIGHHSENLRNSVSGFSKFTDVEGKSVDGTICPNDVGLCKYNQKVYGEVAGKIKPDFIWLDDDIRLIGHGGIRYGCFCDNCIENFSQVIGRKVTRQELISAFKNENSDSKCTLRAQYIDFNRNSINKLVAGIEETIHNISPDMPLGFMSCGDAFGEMDYEEIGKLLSGKNNCEVNWRPGGGYYDEETPMGAVEKAHRIGRQNAMLSENVKHIQSEIENFPYALLRKSARMTTLEAAIYQAAGCTGIAFNILPDDNYEKYFDKIREFRPFYNKMTEIILDTKPTGIGWVWGKDHIKREKSVTWERDDKLFTLGFSPDYSPVNEESQIFVVMEDDIVGATHEEIMKLLSLGLYIDYKTLNHLNRMGYGEYTGFICEKTYDKDTIELFTSHSLNGSFAGTRRDARQSFWWSCDGASLKSTDGQGQSLAKLIDYSGNVLADCTVGIYENILGGRICVAGYFPLTLIYSQAKTEQLKQVIRWLSKDTIEGYIVSYHRVNVWIRKTKENKLTAVLLNTSFDFTEELTVALRTNTNQICFFSESAEQKMITAFKQENGYSYYKLPDLGAWSICNITE